ncbi:uncharacterized protein [Dermacentor andersoni]|uniref:uncharacterized protein n=1 Tax=Dermacentor andersoni TaxID=34620 RepID=UPI002155A4B9|nr:uncharacterized protein LOC126540063 [Dermacentor andersoni]
MYPVRALFVAMTTTAAFASAAVRMCPGDAVFRPAPFGGEEFALGKVTREPYGAFNVSGSWSYLVPRAARDVNVTFRWWLPGSDELAPLVLPAGYDGNLPGERLGDANLTVVCHGLPPRLAAGAHALVSALRRHRPSDALLEVVWNADCDSSADGSRAADIYYCPAHAAPADSAQYQQAAGDSRLVARAVARTLSGLVNDHGYELARIHLLGFGVGAHVVGFVADELRYFDDSDKLGRLTLLDPTAPLFVAKLGLAHLSGPGRAAVSEAVHTSSAARCGYGIVERLADLDVYVNGGERQPRCRSSAMCSHVVALVYYARTMERCATDTELLPGYWTPGKRGVVQVPLADVSCVVSQHAGPSEDRVQSSGASPATRKPCAFAWGLVAVAYLVAAGRWRC